jgi:hypothetical protein
MMTHPKSEERKEGGEERRAKKEKEQRKERHTEGLVVSRAEKEIPARQRSGESRI